MTQQKFGRYEIKAEIGRGGMASVLQAYDPRFERDVAIKVLPQTMLHDSQFRARFEREAKMVALLEHDAIVPVYDFGEEEGQPYIVMRYMSGGSLSDRLKEGALTVKESMQILSRLAPALDAAHARGIIHRDLKPANILFDQYGNAFLSDFGIARLMSSSGATLTGEAIVGTPAYMSPEQVQGDRDLDGRSDIYAMGVILYSMLTGAPPYQADTPAKVMMKHLLDPVPSLDQARGDLPPVLGGVISRSMAKDPDDRYSTMMEMAQSCETAIRSAGFTQGLAGGDATVIQGGATVIASPPTKTRQGSQVGAPARGTPPPGTLPRGNAVQAPPPGEPPQEAVNQTPKRGIPAWGWLLGGAAGLGLLAVILIGIFILLRGGGPGAQATPTQENVLISYQVTDTPALTEAPTSTQLPTQQPAPTATEEIVPTSTATPEPPTATTEPTPTPEDTPAPPAPVAIEPTGGADMIAFLHSNNVYTMNIDGSGLEMLTNDGAAKVNLQWTPDGEGVAYITGKCIKIAWLESKRIDTITCFENAGMVEAFEISPDGAQVAISLDALLYIVRYDLEGLQNARRHSQLAALATCEHFAPVKREGNVWAKQVRWADDSSKLALLVPVPMTSIQVDKILVVDISTCAPTVRLLDEFPGATRFEIPKYMENPNLQNFSFDGTYLFSLIGQVRNGGFGDLYLYNMNLHRAELKVNPISNKCCYRDPVWSPDGRYLLVAYQEYSAENMTQLYYIEYGTMGTGMKYTPLPLGDLVFGRTERPWMALRRANTP